MKDLYMWLYDLGGIEGWYDFKLCFWTVQYYVLLFSCFTQHCFEESFIYQMYYYHVLVKKHFLKDNPIHIK